jgi:hypothetical protein
MMNFSDTERKVFKLLDSSNAGEREAALHQLHALLAKRVTAGLPLRPFQELDETHVPLANHVPLADHEQLKQDFDEAAKVLNDLSAKYDKLLVKYRTLNAGRTALLWLQMHWKRCATVGVLLAGAGGGFEYWDRQQHAAERKAADAQMAKSLDRIAAQVKLDYTGDYSSSSVVNIDGKPYWAVLYGVTEQGSYTDANGRPVALHCVHLYAEPAVSDLPGAYRAPRPFNALGWLRWPERAVNCVITDDAKQRTDGNDRQIGNSGSTEIPDAGIVEDPRDRWPRIFGRRHG